ncbi:pentatricopeptide repeat-containing protein At1g31920-like isoform X2 [Musa acuminata AAA Group]|uniref:pentatricopeptide repeat-containing protein At1g31920-like isoform X2 n=1 Tax=Musa acuminata AAA Group TaxID=214697 RepID=UPI0031D16C5F
MVGGLALHQTQPFIPPPPSRNPASHVSEHRPREQLSCLPPPHQVKTMEEFKKLHARFIKLGLDRVPRHAGDLLLACSLSEWGSMDYARSIFLGLDDPGTFDFNTMIRGSLVHGDPQGALLFYPEMLRRDVEPDNFTFPLVLKACSQLSALAQGLQIHGHAAKHGFQCDVFVQNSLINMYGKCGEVERSCRAFEQMGSCRTVVSWSALTAAHTRMGLWGKCLEIFAMMTREGLRPDESSMTSLIDMYISCGCLEKGIAIFETMSEKNTWAYSVVISGLAMHGEGERALQVFSDMLHGGHEPDEAIYVGVLSACSHAGLLDEGLRCFDRMRVEHRIPPSPQHYGCVIDLMARAGKLREAYELMESMPAAQTEAAWRCLLSACKTHGELEVAERASRNLEELNARNSGDYINLSNMYAEAKRWSDAAMTRREMVDRGLVQAPGYSRVEVKGKMHTFVSNDKRHPQRRQVYEMAYQMEWQLRLEGYTPEEKRRMVGGAESQKLAIAFALLNTSQGSPIRIITNLRMGKECHTYAALVSTIFEREIMVRDRNRFHCFRQGVCTCGDHW